MPYKHGNVIYYLEGSKCIVITDHNALTYLKSQQNLSRASGSIVGVFGAIFSLSMGVSS